jgi:hypothetical protein
MPGATELAQGRHSGFRHEDDIAPLAAVTAVGAAARNVGLATKGRRPVAAGSGRHEDPNLVSEHGVP